MIYVYKCTACEEVIEALQKMTDKPLKKCKHCGKHKLVKQLTAPSFQIKGGYDSSVQVRTYTKPSGKVNK